MSELVLKMAMSMDGYVARLDGSLDWISPTFTDEVNAWTLDTLRHARAHVMGSTTFRAMAAHWPNDDTDVGALMNDIPKVVFSTTMTDSTWTAATFVAGAVAPEIARLKEDGADGHLLAHGGVRFARSLCQTDLVDELRLLVHPVVLGRGESIFTRGFDLNLIDTKVLRGGVVAHVCRPLR